MRNREALVRLYEDGNLNIDNNGAKRSLRGIAVGQKHRLSFGSDNDGRTAPVLRDFVAICRRLEINPFLYLRDFFNRIGAHHMSRPEELLPHNWRAAQTAIENLPA